MDKKKTKIILYKIYIHGMRVSIIIVRYLELQSSGRRDEIRFHYTWISSDGKDNVHTETFPFRLADNTWHKLSLSVSGPEVQLLVDCLPVYTRVAPHLPDRSFKHNDISLFVGQRSIEDQSVLKVSITFSFISHLAFKNCLHSD